MQNNNQIETWVNIPNYSFYQASDFGRIRSFKGKEIYYLTMCIDKNGYRNVRMIADDETITTKHVHRIISDLFLVKPNVDYKLVIDHINRDKTNNNVNNLRFVSYTENAKNSERCENSKPKYVKKQKVENVGVRKVVLKNGEERYTAVYSIKSKKIHLGTFETEQEAILARKEYLKK